jgi:lipid-binding SYLF domain-containing protein
MKKTFTLCLAALLSAAAASRAPAAPQRAELVKDVESCEAILQEFMTDRSLAIPGPVLRSAHALIIVNQFKAGFLFGVKGGYGVVMVKKPGGRWSLPVLISANEASFGLQLGAKSVETIYVITDDATPHLLFKERFNIGVDAKAVVGPKAAEAEKDYRPLLTTPVLVYSKSTGLYAGATVKAGRVARDDEANFVLYDTTYTMPELLYSDWVKPVPEVEPLMRYVQELAP